MSDARHPDQEKLAELLLQWEEAWERGEEVSAEDLCAQCPELLEPLRQQIAMLKKMAWMKEDPAQCQGAESAEDPLLGCVLEQRYRLEELISQGGFGRVYRGYDVELQRPVAVKLPRPDRPMPEKLAESLLEEARRAARLRHPGIVSVYDVVREKDQVFLISQLVEGESLAELLQRRSFSPQQAALLVAEVAEALQHAHDCGFVHLDIKPENILIDSGGKPLLTDFGIAKTRDQLARQKTVAAGTLPYMAPEQVAGGVQLVDARTDVHALGVLLYELLTGRQPYRGSNPATLREDILLRRPVPPRKLKPAVPRELEKVCLKALAKHPEERYASAGEMARALRRACHAAGLKQKGGWALVLAGVIGILALAWAWSGSLQKQQPSPKEHAPDLVWQTRLQPATHAPCVAYSPAGNLIAAGTLDKTVRLLDAETGREVAKLWGHENWVRCLSWSPDGRQLLSGSGGVNINGKMHLGRDHTVRLWSVEQAKQLLCLRGHVAPVVTMAADWKRNRVLTGSNDGTVRLWDLKRGEELWQFSPRINPISAIAWIVRDQQLYAGGHDGVIRLWNLKDRQELAVLDQHQATITFLCLSPDQKFLFSCSSDHTARLWNRHGKLLRVYPHPNGVTGAAFSPRMECVATSCLDGIVRLWSLTEERVLKHLHGHQGGVLAVAFSPDGKRLVSTSNDGTVRLWRVPDDLEAEALTSPSDLYPPEDAPVLAFDGRSRILTPVERFAPVTIEAWVRPRSYMDTGCQFIVGSDIQGRFGIGLALCRRLLAAERIPFPEDKDEHGIILSNVWAPVKRWSHLAVVFAPKETRLYFNGHLVKIGPPTQARGGTRFVVGCLSQDDQADFFFGDIYAVRITRGERYRGSFKPPLQFSPEQADSPHQTVLIYDARHVEGDRVLDLSGNGNHGTWKR